MYEITPFLVMLFSKLLLCISKLYVVFVILSKGSKEVYETAKLTVNSVL